MAQCWRDQHTLGDKLDMEKIAYSINEVCELAGVKRDLLYSEINAGNLPTLKIGRRRLIRHESLLTWIAERERLTQKEMGFAPSPTGTQAK